MNETILIVEDEVEIANAIEIYLKNQGYQTYIAGDGKAALDILDQKEVHLAIVDIMMESLLP